MAGVILTTALRAEYQRLFDSCVIRSNRTGVIKTIVDDLAEHQARYANVSRTVGAPWFFVAVIHNMESSRNFGTHLYNGDPLTDRTVSYPPGRPTTGQPPFTWEESAIDVLRWRRIDQWSDWSMPGLLYKLEGYNGWGYHLYHSNVLSPYLWSFSNHYTRGKYVSDGSWSETAVSQQCGAAVLLRSMVERGIIAAEGDWFAQASAEDLEASIRKVLNEGTAFGQKSWAGTSRANLHTAQVIVNLLNQEVVPRL
jgi:lysozyme family protein